VEVTWCKVDHTGGGKRRRGGGKTICRREKGGNGNEEQKKRREKSGLSPQERKKMGKLGMLQTGWGGNHADIFGPSGPKSLEG